MSFPLHVALKGSQTSEGKKNCSKQMGSRNAVVTQLQQYLCLRLSLGTMIL